MSLFDRKLGKEVWEQIPTTPGIYFFHDASGGVIYVGKAKNLRRRLGQYRNLKRLKKHRKMKKILSQATGLTFRECQNEREALLAELTEIQTRRPRLNVSGAFYFLYPCLRIELREGVYSFELSRKPDLQSREWFGAFRSRGLTRDAVGALQRLLLLLGHPEGKFQRSWKFSLRGVPLSLQDSLRSFFLGDSPEFLGRLSLELLERAGARARAAQVEEDLKTLKQFYDEEALPLARMREAASYPHAFVSQKDRDRLKVAPLPNLR